MNDDPLTYWATCKIKEPDEKEGEQIRDVSDSIKSTSHAKRKTLVSNAEETKYTISYHGVSLEELKTHAEGDWEEIRQNPAALDAFAKMIQTSRLMRAGIKPPEYTHACHCKWCGWVWLSEGSPLEVLGCPWCVIHASGVSIPRPPTSSTL